MFLTYYAYLVGIKELTDYKNVRRGYFQNNFNYLSLG